MNWKKKFMWAASFLVSLFVCGTALAAGNDAFADTPAQGKEENQVYRFGTENNANDITQKVARLVWKIKKCICMRASGSETARTGSTA